jgi:hypothetical protein
MTLLKDPVEQILAESLDGALGYNPISFLDGACHADVDVVFQLLD